MLLMFLATFFSCKTEKLEASFEPVKDISGSWRLVQVSRNGTDLTSRFDFSTFRINFQDSSFTLANPVPFLVNTDGTWRFDDPAYPFKISMTGKDGVTQVSSLLYPVVKGKRNMILTISPGCPANSYQYTLERVD